MSQDRFTLFEKVTTGKLMEAISKSMDDFLYIFDIQNSKLELSEAAVDRFMIPGRFLDDPLSAVYEEDREMLMKDLSEVAAGKEKTHDLHYRDFAFKIKSSPFCKGSIWQNGEFSY